MGHTEQGLAQGQGTERTARRGQNVGVLRAEDTLGYGYQRGDQGDAYCAVASGELDALSRSGGRTRASRLITVR